MGEVYRARDSRLGREVALKVLGESRARDREALERFEREARAASALNHPNIVTIYDIGRAQCGSESIAYIAMELVEGQSLRQMISEGPVEMDRLLDIATQTVRALAAAHQKGIVHRDLKPENIMLARETEGQLSLVKILDFGLAKLESRASGNSDSSATATSPLVTGTGTIMGTAAYMSPEQASGRPTDFRSDQFSLGAVLYEMATGRRAFGGGSAVETLAAILRDDPQLQYNFLSDLTCVDWYPAEPRCEVVYHLLSIPRKARLRLKVRLGGEEPRLESVTSVWPAANFFEREVVDLFGVYFQGHPSLRRILMPEDWEGHPLRRDYPVEGYG